MCDYLISHQIHLPKDIYYVPVHLTPQNHVLEHPMVHIWDIFVSKMNKNHNTDTCVSQNRTKIPKLAKVTYSLSMVHPSGIQICCFCTLLGPKLGYKWCPLTWVTDRNRNNIGHLISHLGPKGLPDDLVRIWYDQLYSIKDHFQTLKCLPKGFNPLFYPKKIVDSSYIPISTPSAQKWALAPVGALWSMV